MTVLRLVVCFESSPKILVECFEATESLVRGSIVGRLHLLGRPVIKL